MIYLVGDLTIVFILNCKSYFVRFGERGNVDLSGLPNYTTTIGLSRLKIATALLLGIHCTMEGPLVYCITIGIWSLTTIINEICNGFEFPIKHKKMIKRRESFCCISFRIEIDNGRAVLYIEDAKKTDAAWFQCTAVNVAGSASTKAKLVVTRKYNK